MRYKIIIWIVGVSTMIMSMFIVDVVGWAIWAQGLAITLIPSAIKEQNK